MDAIVPSNVLSIVAVFSTIQRFSFASILAFVLSYQIHFLDEKLSEEEDDTNETKVKIIAIMTVFLTDEPIHSISLKHMGELVIDAHSDS